IKYISNTHFHGDHTGGNANFQKDGATVIAQDNIRLRLAAGGNKNGTTGQSQPPAPAGGVPKETYSGGVKVIEVGGRKAELHHVYNAHTDGDTWVYFADANVICTGDVMNNRHRYQQVDFANGGDIRGMIRASNDWLPLSNDNTKIVVGHGNLAKKSDVAEYNAMVKTARERVEKLMKEGKTEAQIVAAKPLADLDKTWADNDQAAANFVKQVYNSFKRSSPQSAGAHFYPFELLIPRSPGLSRRPRIRRHSSCRFPTKRAAMARIARSEHGVATPVFAS